MDATIGENISNRQAIAVKVRCKVLESGPAKYDSSAHVGKVLTVIIVIWCKVKEQIIKSVTINITNGMEWNACGLSECHCLLTIR